MGWPSAWVPWVVRVALPLGVVRVALPLEVVEVLVALPLEVVEILVALPLEVVGAWLVDRCQPQYRVQEWCGPFE